jgi:aryl-alcohol dehydrogenase-like predicted oxidoreductase
MLSAKENTMKPRKLGSTNIEITPIGLGCWQFSQGAGMIGGVWDTLAQATMTDIVKTALDGGINWFDTAEVYGNGKSEEALAAALKALDRHPGDVVVATKWWPFLRTANHLVSSVIERQRVLAPYPIDLLQIHQPMSLSSPEKQARALAKLLKDKQVKSVGVSNFDAKTMRLVHRILKEEGQTLASNQVRYNLADNAIVKDGTLDAAKELGITIIAYSPLAQGLLTGRFHDDPAQAAKVHAFRRMRNGLDAKGLAASKPLIDTLKAIAAQHSVAGGPATSSQVALNWLVTYHGDTVVAIPGASKAKQAFEAAHALDFVLTDDQRKALADLH